MSQAQQQVWATIQTEIGNHQSKITLPSEAEWEKAARGPSTGSGGPSTGFASGRGRLYPWGDEPDPNRANYENSGIGATSPVGCFPGGASPYGCGGMSGNVWEWTRSLWGKDVGKPDYKYPYDPADGREDLTPGTDVLRVLRGGAFYNYLNYVRCAVRLRNDPVNRNNDIGFRVVVVGVASR